ncbi:MAG: hypothetical protein U0487_02765 [Patescibacteria group bacterium]
MSLLLLTIAGSIIAVVVGSFWYSNATPTGKLHMKYLGFDKLTPEEQQAKIKAAMPGMPKIYAAQMALSALTAFATVFIITMSVKNGVPITMAVGFVLMNWLCFMVPIIGQGVLWGNVDRSIAWQKFFSDSASNLTTLLLTSLLVSFFV